MKVKNVKLIAEHFRQTLEKTSGNHIKLASYRLALRDTAENLATILKLDNPKFDRDKFINSIYFDALSRKAKECGL